MANCTQILLNRLKKYLAEEVGKCEKNFEEIKEIGETIWEYSNGVNKKTLMKIEEVSKRLVSSENSNVLLENGISEQKSILQMLESEQIEIRKSYEEM